MVNMAQLLLLLLLFNACCSAFASDSTLSKEVDLLSRSVKYIKGIKNQDPQFNIAVLYDSNEPRSELEAKAFLAALQVSRSANKIGLFGQLVEIKELAHHSSHHFVYVSRFLNHQYEIIYQHARERRVFPFSTNKTCVESRCCVLSFDASSGLDIFLNQKNLRALGFGVNGAFKFMVKRI